MSTTIIRKLGRSDIEVSAICMGCWTIAGGDMWGPQDESQAMKTLHTAVDEGITFFDSAEGYGAGRSEELIGKAFKFRIKIVPKALRVIIPKRKCGEAS